MLGLFVHSPWPAVSVWPCSAVPEMLGAVTFTGGPPTIFLEIVDTVEALPAEDRRHPYRITAAGREHLRVRLSEAARIAQVGLRRIAEALP